MNKANQPTRLMSSGRYAPMKQQRTIKREKWCIYPPAVTDGEELPIPLTSCPYANLECKQCTDSYNREERAAITRQNEANRKTNEAKGKTALTNPGRGGVVLVDNEEYLADQERKKRMNHD